MAVSRVCPGWGIHPILTQFWQSHCEGCIGDKLPQQSWWWPGPAGTGWGWWWLE